MARNKPTIPSEVALLTKLYAERRNVRAEEIYNIVKRNNAVEWPTIGYFSDARKKQNELIAVPRSLFSDVIQKLYGYANLFASPIVKVMYECPMCGALYECEDDALGCVECQEPRR